MTLAEAWRPEPSEGPEPVGFVGAFGHYGYLQVWQRGAPIGLLRITAADAAGWRYWRRMRPGEVLLLPELLPFETVAASAQSWAHRDGYRDAYRHHPARVIVLAAADGRRRWLALEVDPECTLADLRRVEGFR